MHHKEIYHRPLELALLSRDYSPLREWGAGVPKQVKQTDQTSFHASRRYISGGPVPRDFIPFVQAALVLVPLELMCINVFHKSRRTCYEQIRSRFHFLQGRGEAEELGR